MQSALIGFNLGQASELPQPPFRADLCLIANMVLTIQRKVQCVLWFSKFDSGIRVRREYRRVYGVKPPHHSQIHFWYKKFKETGSLLLARKPGRPSVSVQTVEAINEVYARSPRTSARSVAQRLGNVSHVTVNLPSGACRCQRGMALV